MKYELDGTIKGPRNEVSALLFAHDQLGQWQEGLVLVEQLDNLGLLNGAKTRLKYLMGKRDIEMVETIERNNLPDEMAIIYEAKNVWNRVVYRFEDLPDGGTHWVVECEFKCGGLVKVLSIFMPNMFRNSTEKAMKSFTEFAEKSLKVGVAA